MAKIILERPMTREQFSALQAFAESKGHPLPFVKAELSESGVTIWYEWDGETLRVALVKKPWIIPESKVRAKVEQLFAEATT